MHSLTDETIRIKKVLTIISLFNKCIYIIILTANFEFTNRAFNGKYSDFNKEWF